MSSLDEEILPPVSHTTSADKSCPIPGDLISPKGLQLSFAGCGFLGIYHVGVSACLRRCAPGIPLASIAGASAGAMAGACLLSGADLGVIRSSIVGAAADARSSALGPFSPTFSIHDKLREGLSLVLPADAHVQVSGRLVVSLTRVCDGQNVLFTHFSSRQELIETLLCSSFIPFFSGLRPGRVRGVRYMDGGFSNNCPLTGPATVTVSPFSGEADVCPADASASMMAFSVTNTNFLINRRNIQRFVHALFPPDPEALRKVCQQGFNDMLDFLQKNGLVSCPRCSEILSLASSSNLKNMASSEEEDGTITAASEMVDTCPDSSVEGGKTAKDDVVDTDCAESVAIEVSNEDTGNSTVSSVKERKRKVSFLVSESECRGTDCAENGSHHGCVETKADANLMKASDGNEGTSRDINSHRVGDPNADITLHKCTDISGEEDKECSIISTGIIKLDYARAVAESQETQSWVARLGDQDEHLCKDVRSSLDLKQRPSFLGVGLSESVCRMQCYNCADCRKILQEALMTGDIDAPLRVPRSLVAVTFSSLKVLTFPLTRSLGLQYSLIKSLLGLLPLCAVLRLYHFTASSAVVMAAVLARRRTSIRKFDPETSPRKGPTLKEICENPFGIDKKRSARKEDRLPRIPLRRNHSLGSYDLVARGGDHLTLGGEHEGLQNLEILQYREDLKGLQPQDGLQDLLQRSLVSYYYEEGHMTECWALTTLTKMFPEP